jgi:hypothetical protein
MARNPSTVRLKVSQEVAKIVGAGAPRDVQLAAARGALPLSGKDQLMALFLLINGRDGELRRAAVETLKSLPTPVLESNLASAGLHPKLLELIARLRISEPEVTGQIIMHPAVEETTLIYLARHGDAATLEILAGNHGKLESCPELIEEMLANPLAERSLQVRLRSERPQNPPVENDRQAASTANEEPDSQEQIKTDEMLDADDFDGIDTEIMEDQLSKYQLSLNLEVAEKIKMGLTGDKEWRSLLIKDANKLVQGAVLKNPRITDGEVIMVAKNKQSSDEMIRLILLNKDWMKLYEVKKALVWHPKTPLPRALRLIGFLTLKDLKELARSRNVQTAISTSARKEVERKQKKV